jgi:hypothetical protein
LIFICVDLRSSIVNIYVNEKSVCLFAYPAVVRLAACPAKSRFRTALTSLHACYGTVVIGGKLIPKPQLAEMLAGVEAVASGR